ncbi:MAG: cupin domain-containing protein [Alphaproteobacteria bacterium]|nr:cupin domain-containing protein [Alphaproteobacteria bacterium]
MATSYRTPPETMKAELDALYARLDPLYLDPGFRVMDVSIWKEPKKALEPAIWKWSEGREALSELARVIGTEHAERRNLIMRNPAEGHVYGTLRTMISAYQLMLPGEFARSHWHSPHALRVILEGAGSYTVVNGVRIDMHPGDVVLTPGGDWHWHGVDGSAPCAWLDILDRPLTIMLEPLFQDYHPDGHEPMRNADPDSPLLFSWADTVARLDGAARDAGGCFGARIELGGAAPALPTLALHMQRLAAGERTTRFRSSANYLYLPLEGEGRSVVDGKVLDWARGDVFVVPCWRPVEHEASSDAILFSATDEPLQRACGYLREERGLPG